MLNIEEIRSYAASKFTEEEKPKVALEVCYSEPGSYASYTYYRAKVFVTVQYLHFQRSRWFGCSIELSGKTVDEAEEKVMRWYKSEIDKWWDAHTRDRGRTDQT